MGDGPLRRRDPPDRLRGPRGLRPLGGDDQGGHRARPRGRPADLRAGLRRHDGRAARRPPRPRRPGPADRARVGDGDPGGPVRELAVPRAMRPGLVRQARVAARRRVDGHDDAGRAARPGVRHGLEPRVRPGVRRAEGRPRRAVDVRGVRAHRARPAGARGRGRARGEPDPVLRHGRARDRALARAVHGLAGRARSRRSRGAGATTSRS